MLNALRKLVTLKMAPYLNSIKPDKVLIKKLAIPSLGLHFYSYGITFFKKNGLKIKPYYNPYFIFIMEMLYFTRSLISLYVPLQNHRNYFIYSGDYMYFIHAKTHINIAATQYMMIGISILMINYYRYLRGNRPIFMESFEMLAGRATPKSLGFRDPNRVMHLIIKSRLILSITYFNTRLVLVVSFVLSLLPLMVNLNSFEVLLYGLPWSIIFAISSYYTFSSYFWHNAYFYILCHQIKARLQEADERVEQLIQKQKQLRRGIIESIKKQYQTIADEVNLYNNTYWASYLILVIGFLSTFNNVVLYSALFVRMNPVVQFSLLYANLMSCMAIFFTLNTASFVYRKSNQSRLLLNALYVAVHDRQSHFQSLFKLTTLIEELTRRRIGFYFFNLFIIDYFKFLEIAGLIIAYFLKITDMSRHWP